MDGEEFTKEELEEMHKLIASRTREDLIRENPDISSLWDGHHWLIVEQPFKLQRFYDGKLIVTPVHDIKDDRHFLIPTPG